MRSILPTAAAVVLLGLALALGYGIYQKAYLSKPQPSTSNQLQSTLPPTPQVRNNPSWVASLSAIEQSYFNTPTASSSSTEKQEYYNLLSESGKKGPNIRIGKDCQPTPLTYSVGSEMTVKFVNADSQTHTIILGKDDEKTISADEAVTVNIKEDKRGHVSGYGCDSYKLVGFLIIAP